MNVNIKARNIIGKSTRFSQIYMESGDSNADLNISIVYLIKIIVLMKGTSL